MRRCLRCSSPRRHWTLPVAPGLDRLRPDRHLALQPASDLPAVEPRPGRRRRSLRQRRRHHQHRQLSRLWRVAARAALASAARRPCRCLAGRHGAILSRLLAAGLRPLSIRVRGPIGRRRAVPYIAGVNARWRKPMPLKVAVQMDHVSTVTIAGDTSFALSLEAQRRGHALYPLHARPAVDDRRQGLRARRGNEGLRREGQPFFARRTRPHRFVRNGRDPAAGRIRPST